jgi:hypothetical protein
MKRVLAVAVSVLAACGGSSSDPDLSPYQTTAAAEATYLAKSDAQATYLAKPDAASTYLTQGSAADLYLGRDAAATTYLSLDTAAATYLSVVDASAYLLESDANATFLTQSAAAALYLTKDDASGTYLSQPDASSTYLAKSDAASTYLSQASASTTYLSQAAAASTYQRPLQGSCAIGQALRGFDQAGAPICGMADCPTGQADCDGDPANGCEADLLSPSTCGTCSNTCGGGQKCWPGGACTTSLVTGKQLQQINAWAGYGGTWSLCFRVSRDGRSPALFHTQCNNRGSTFFVTQTPAGKLVGGFAGIPWQSTGGYRSDPSAFLFSLSNGFKHVQGGSAGIQNYLNLGLYDYVNYGPTFGGGHDFFTDLSNVYVNLGHSYSCRVGAFTQATCQNDFAGAYSFALGDLEVYAQQ